MNWFIDMKDWEKIWLFLLNLWKTKMKKKSKIENRKKSQPIAKSKIEKRKTKIEIFFRVAEPVKIQLFILIIFNYYFLLWLQSRCYSLKLRRYAIFDVRVLWLLKHVQRIQNVGTRFSQIILNSVMSRSILVLKNAN